MAVTDGRKTATFEDEALMYEGANMRQLAKLFKKDHRTLADKIKLANIKPVGKRFNADLYDVAEVAGRIHNLTEEEIHRALTNMHASELPKMITKEYWAGQRSRQEYELKAGDLWPTNKVVERVSDMVKSLKTELDLMVDGVERATELTERQRETIKGLVKGCKMNMLENLKKNFVAQPVKHEPVVYVSPLDEDDDPL